MEDEEKKREKEWVRFWAKGKESRNIKQQNDPTAELKTRVKTDYFKKIRSSGLSCPPERLVPESKLWFCQKSNLSQVEMPK